MPNQFESQNGMNRRAFIGRTSVALAGIAALKTQAFAAAAKTTGLKDLYKKDFYIGAALGAGMFQKPDQQLIDLVKKEFNSITSDNNFKWEVINPADDEWKFEFPDKFVKWGEENDMYILGHCLVWHSQVPRNLFTENGQPISKDALIKKMEKHIQTLVDRYKGRIQAWDVVNEAITSEEHWRPTQWIKIIGPEFIERAFHAAHEADPKAHLIYNDYNTDEPKKRDYIVEMVNDFKKRGVPIHGIGMQDHIQLDSPGIEQMEASIVAFKSTGCKLHVTELDVDVLPYDWGRTAEVSTNRAYAETLNPYKDGLPAEVDKKLAKRYEDIFRLYLKHRDAMERVTFWGVSDDTSWKNNFPVRGRTNYPLLFDRQRQPKSCYFSVANLKK